MKYLSQIEDILGIGAYFVAILLFIIEETTLQDINFVLKTITALIGITYVAFKTRYEIVKTKKIKKEIKKLERETK